MSTYLTIKNTIHTLSSYVQHIIYLSYTQPFLNSLSLYYLIHPYKLLASFIFSLDFIYNTCRGALAYSIRQFNAPTIN
jgi:hypothetical protein